VLIYGVNRRTVEYEWILPFGGQTWQTEGLMGNSSIHGENSIAMFDYPSLPNILSVQSTLNYDLITVEEKKQNHGMPFM
jgi:hypothetical protein